MGHVSQTETHRDRDVAWGCGNDHRPKRSREKADEYIAAVDTAVLRREVVGEKWAVAAHLGPNAGFCMCEMDSHLLGPLFQAQGAWHGGCCMAGLFSNSAA